jgi:hypothetical protein
VLTNFSRTLTIVKFNEICSVLLELLHIDSWTDGHGKASRCSLQPFIAYDPKRNIFLMEILQF